MKAESQEVEFAKKRRALQNEIDLFVQDYIKEAGVEQIGGGGFCAGTCHPHTLEGHDLAFQYHLQDPQIPEHKELVEIRIRQEKWQPKLTIWGRKSMMESFLCDQLTDEVKSKIMDCIDKTITQS